MNDASKKEAGEILVHLFNRLEQDLNFINKIDQRMFDGDCTPIEFRNRMFTLAGSLESMGKHAGDAARDMGKVLDKMLKIEEMRDEKPILHSHD